MNNPLRQPEPPAAQCVYQGRFQAADLKGKYIGGSPSYDVRVTREQIWLSDELSIPLASFRSADLVTSGVLLPTRGLVLRFENPITRQNETIGLCRMDPIGIGIHSQKPLEELRDALRKLPRATAPAPAVSPARAAAPPDKLKCEDCGSEPAFYVGYAFLVSALVVWYRSAVTRRLHCRRHVALHGIPPYLITVLTGWFGISILAYPFYVWIAARNLRPAVGGLSYALGIAPTPAAIGLVWWLLSR